MLQNLLHKAMLSTSAQHRCFTLTLHSADLPVSFKTLSACVIQQRNVLAMHLPIPTTALCSQVTHRSSQVSLTAASLTRLTTL